MQTPVPQLEIVQKHSVKFAILGVAGFVVLALLAVGGVWYLSLPTPTQAVKQANDLNAKGKYVQATAELKRAQWRAITKNDRLMLLGHLGATASNGRNLDGALDYYKQYDKIQPNDYSNSMAEGDVLLRLGRKNEAKEAYQRALEALKKLPVVGPGETPADLEAYINGIDQKVPTK